MHFSRCTSHYVSKLYALDTLHLTRCTSLDVLILKGSAQKNPSRSFREKSNVVSGQEMHIQAEATAQIVKFAIYFADRDRKEFMRHTRKTIYLKALLLQSMRTAKPTTTIAEEQEIQKPSEN